MRGLEVQVYKPDNSLRYVGLVTDKDMANTMFLDNLGTADSVFEWVDGFDGDALEVLACWSAVGVVSTSASDTTDRRAIIGFVPGDGNL